MGLLSLTDVVLPKMIYTQLMKTSVEQHVDLWSYSCVSLWHHSMWAGTHILELSVFSALLTWFSCHA